MENTVESNIRNFSISATIEHVRKNHALEHATIHVLSEKFPELSVSGYSIYKGFWIIGHTQIQTVQEAVDVAKARLTHGEVKLAQHPNCGTNLAVAGLVCALGSMIAMSGADTRKERLNRFSSLMMAGIVGAYVGKPLGMEVQRRWTTNPNVADLSIVSINSGELNGTPSFFVETRLNQAA